MAYKNHLSRLDANKYKRNGRDAPPLTGYVVQSALVITWSRRHLLLHHFHRQNSNSQINRVTDVERKVFNEEIVCNEAIFAKLYFNRDSLFYEVRLVV